MPDDCVVIVSSVVTPDKRQVDKASRGYKDLNLNAFKIIRSGGYLITFSCSGAINRDLFQKILLISADNLDCELLLPSRGQ